MRDLKKVKGLMWIVDDFLNSFGSRSAYYDLPSGTRALIVVGENESGWEHVSVSLRAKRLPTWEEMCLIKDLFWEKDEEVVQIHPKEEEYVNIAEALHLWRPKNGDWSIMNHRG